MDEKSRCLEKYLDHIKNIKKFSPNTIKAYRQDIEQFLNYFREKNLPFEKKYIRDFISTIFIRTRNKTTIARKIYALRSYFTYLNEIGIIEKNPMAGVRIPKLDKKLPQILTEKEMLNFLDSLPEENYLQLRNKAMFEFLYATGLRLSEMANLKISNINFDERLVRVLGKGKKERIVPFTEQAKEMLLKYIKASHMRFQKSEEFVFLNARGEKISERSIERILKSVFKTLMQSTKRVYPHLFRHSFATHLLQRGANLRLIQELLGHSNLSTTEKYTTLNYLDLLKIYQKFHPRGKE
jgi:integrase/recombinase XerC